MREISIANRHPRLRLNRREVEQLIHTLDAHAAAVVAPARSRRLWSVPPGELSLVFLTDAALAKLHADFLDDPSVTDVITFAGDPALGTAGEICVSADAAARQVGLAAGQRQPAQIEKFSAELTLYLVHGWLHLAGHDDLEPRKKRAMRRAEARAMKLLTRAKRLPQFRFSAKK